MSQKIEDQQKRKAEYFRAYRQRRKEHRRELARRYVLTPAGKEMKRKSYLKLKLKHGYKDRPPKMTLEEKRAKQRKLNQDYWKKNRVSLKKKNTEYRLKNMDRIRDWQRNYDNLPHRKVIIAKAKKEYFKTNPQARARRSCYRRIYDLIRQRGGDTRRIFVEALIGCTRADLIKWLESQFTSEMSWKNYGNGKGNWTIDHRTALSSFDLEDSEQAKVAFHWSNVQPKMAVENSRKGNRFAEPIGQLPLLALKVA